MPSKFCNIRYKGINPYEVLQGYGSAPDDTLVPLIAIYDDFPVSPPTIRALRRKKKFPPTVLINNRRFCRLGELRKWVWNPHIYTQPSDSTAQAA